MHQMRQALKICLKQSLVSESLMPLLYKEAERLDLESKRHIEHNFRELISHDSRSIADTAVIFLLPEMAEEVLAFYRAEDPVRKDSKKMWMKNNDKRLADRLSKVYFRQLIIPF